MLCITTASRELPQPHHLHKKQDDTGDTDACDAAINNNRCMNGFYQRFATLFLECDHRETAEAYANNCKRSSSGIFCGSVNVDTISDTINTSCGRSPTTCSSDCQALLTSTRAKLGCCINYLNNTNIGDNSGFDYSLWSLCNVELVTEECAPGLNLPNITIDPTCTGLDDNRFYAEALCRAQYFESERDIIAKNCKIDPFVDDNDTCTVNEEGKYCEADNNDDPNDIYNTTFSNCADTSTCDPLCIESLSKITTCCFINEFNGTEDAVKYDWLSYEFWSRCGLNSPGFCKTKLTNGPLLYSGAAILKAPGIAVILAVAMVLPKYF